MNGSAKAIVMLGILVILHELLARALDAYDLIERLLSPGAEALVAIPLAIVLYALRLFLVFAGPGIGLAACTWLLLAWRARATSRAAG